MILIICKFDFYQILFVMTMKEVGYDLLGHDSKSLQQIPQEKYEYAITMGCGDECPMVRAKHMDDWQIPDPKYMEPEEFNKVRNFIEGNVKEFISEI